MESTDRIVNDDRLAACWRIQNCYACTHSKHGCGWCPHTSTCVPVSSIFEPISNAQTCPSRDERYELRTKALGCGCSTATFLSVVVTVFVTIAALILLYGETFHEKFSGAAIWAAAYHSPLSEDQICVPQSYGQMLTSSSTRTLDKESQPHLRHRNLARHRAFNQRRRKQNRKSVDPLLVDGQTTLRISPQPYQLLQKRAGASHRTHQATRLVRHLLHALEIFQALLNVLRSLFHVRERRDRLR